MNDQIEVLRRLHAALPDVGLNGWREGQKALEWAIAALSAREGGEAVATEWRWVDERGRAMTKWKVGDPPPMDAVSDEKGTMRVEIRPAQPASQQGEDVAWLRDLDGTGSLHVAAAGDPGAIPVFAHPTGDKVRSDEVRRAVADYMDSEGCSCCQDRDAHELHTKRLAELLGVEPYSDGSGFDFHSHRTAAIDQEKNDGR